MTDFIQILGARRDWAAETLASGSDSRLAVREQNDEFPFDLINTFAVFLDYGSCVLELSTSPRIDWDRLRTGPVSPVALNRFFDVVVSGAAPAGQEESIPVDGLADLHDVIRTKTTEISQAPSQRLYSEASSADRYLRRAVRLRTLLHQLADVEFLGEHNLEFRSDPVREYGYKISTSVKFVDYDPLRTEQTLPTYRVDIQYQIESWTSDKDNTGPTEFPPVNAAIDGCVYINDQQLEYEELEDAIDQVRHRLNRASQALYSMSEADLRMYCAKCHLLPLFLAANVKWHADDPTNLGPFDDITRAVQERCRSGPALEEGNLMTLEYFAALEQGASKILRSAKLSKEL